MKSIKKMFNIFLIMVMLFTEFSPYVVMAQRPTTANKGELYNPQTDTINSSSVSIIENYDTGLDNNQGDLSIRKTVTKTNKEGEYTVKFEIKGNQVQDVDTDEKDVYVVVVLDRSGSMRTCTSYDRRGNCTAYSYDKWDSAVEGAEDFAETLLENISNANIALVTFSGSKNDECTNWVDTGWGSGYCTAYDTYNDAIVIRDFDSEDSNKDFSSIDFDDYGPSGGTNLESGLREAKILLDGDNVPDDAIKYVVVIGDGEPTYYYDDNGLTAGPGNVENGSIQTSIDEADAMADDIKDEDDTNAKIYAIGYEVPVGQTAENVLKGIASPNETLPDGSTKTYYFNADADAVGDALTNIAQSITNLNAGTDVTIKDNIGGSFSLANNSTNTSVSLTLDEITTSYQQVGETFTIKIDPDSETGWHDTNDGFTLTYTDANDETHENIPFNTNPSVYWVQNEYDYKVEYYYENDNGDYVIDNNLTVDSSLTDEIDSAFKNSTLTVSSNGDLVTLVKDSDNTFTFNREASSKTGYEFLYYKNVKGETLESGEISITNKTSDNVIKVYYKKIDLQYTIEHYLETDNGYQKQDNDTEIKDIHYGDIAKYNSKSYTGYSYVSSKDEYNQDNLVVTDKNLVIKLYYDRNPYGYVIRYHYEDITDYVEEGDTREYHETITVTDNMINSHNITGYKYSHTNPESKSIIIETTGNVIDVYYVKDKFDYTVKHHLQELDGTYTEVVEDRKVYTDVEYDSDAIYSQNVYTGYTYVRVDKPNAKVPANDDLVINLYYDRVTYDYVINYHYQDITEVTSESNTAKYHETVTVTNDMINSHNITGYKYSHTNPESKSIVIETTGNVIDVYYVKDKFDYTVKHHLQNLDGTTYTEVVEDRVVYEDVEFGSKATYTKNEYTGYTYVRVDKPNETVPANNDLVINLYYDRLTYNYKVEHYKENLDGTYSLDTTDYYNGVAFGSPASFDENEYTGYTYQKDMTVNGNATVPANNNLVVELYYNRDLCIYRVEYYYDGNIDNTKTDTIDNIKYGTIISDYTDKNIAGYKFVKDENKPLNVGLDANNNVIKVYYEKDKYNYSVEYYYDGVIDSSKTDVYTGTYLDTINSYTDKVITGYKLDKTENVPLTISEVESNNVIKVYYIKDEFNYTVNYYYDGILDEDKTENYTGTYLDVVETYTDKVITGYKFYKHENLPLTITENEEDNVINVYYVKDEFNYSVEYYYDNVIDEDKTENYTRTYLDVIENYTDKVITGYKLDKTENLPLTITEIETNNVIKVYYVKDEFNYSVEYYYDGIRNDSKTENYTGTYLDVIETYTDKVIKGYKFDKHENLPLTITEIETNNVIKVYYVKDEFNYSVEYYYDGIRNDSKTESYTGTYLDVIETYVDKVITGYKLEKEENLPLTISEKVEDNVIKIYYVKNIFNYRVEYYYDNTIDSSKTDVYTATYIDVITSYTDKVIDGYKFDKDENVPLNITEIEENNVIRVYYVKDNFDYKVEHYLENLDGTYTLEETDVYTDVLYNSEATYEVNTYDGYTYNEDKTINKDSLVPANNDLVIKLYYDRNNYSYIVNHYLENINDDEFTLQETDTYTNVEYGSSATYEVNEYVDYTYTSSEYVYSNELTRVLTNEEIIANKLVPANNDLVINVYYVRNQGNVKVQYVVKDVDTGEYIPFNVYGRDIDGNNTEDFVGLDLEDVIITGKIGLEYNTIGRMPLDYTFVGIYEGELSKNNLVSNTEEYSDVIKGETILTYVYEPPYGEGEILPPQTGVENEYSSYLSYILFGVMMTLTYSYIRAIRKED